jgi:DNA-binding CsgD family transcriptional regulator/PAS domain-containing protein
MISKAWDKTPDACTHRIAVRTKERNMDRLVKIAERTPCTQYPFPGIYLQLSTFRPSGRLFIFMEGISKDLKEKISHKIGLISSIADSIPGAIIIHDLPDLNILFMSNVGLTLLGRNQEEIRAMTREEFQKSFFNEDDAKEVTPKIVELLERNSDESVSYFQQVRTSTMREWDWYMSTTKVFMRNEQNRPVSIITVALQIDPEHYFTSKAARLLQENVFLKTHYQQFDSLTKRERVILQLLATGKSAPQIARELNISPATAETHRKKVREKLGARNSHELSQYARAFDLI